MLLIILYLVRYRLTAYLLGLPGDRYKVEIKSGIRIPVPGNENIVLASDIYHPITANEQKFPLILIRSPYGRRASHGAFGLLLAFAARCFAGQGYHVLIQDVRGRFDSTGEFNPYFNEKEDGLATLAWLREKSWFNGEVGMWGPSYLGMVQWVLATEPEIKALIPAVTGSALEKVIFPDGAFDLGLALRWITLFDMMDTSWKSFHLPSLFILWFVELRVKPGFFHLPLANLDKLVVGCEVEFYQNWLALHPDNHDLEPEDIYEPVNFDAVQAGVHLIGGWYDFFLRSILDDYQSLKTARKNPYLTIGPWNHFSRAFTLFDALHLGLAWFGTQFKQKTLRRLPVKIFVMGINKWRELPEFPPPSETTAYYLHGKGQLSRKSSTRKESVSQYDYNPANPTPIMGGPQFHLHAGKVDNRPLEMREDVLVFTSDVLSASVEIIGYVTLNLYIKSSLEYADFYGRLCDVYPSGYSKNICEGLFRVNNRVGESILQPDGSLYIKVDMWATAYRFLPGHAIRLLVSSGAHPHWNRNPGTGNVMGTDLKIAHQTIFHDKQHPSALLLPVVVI